MKEFNNRDIAKKHAEYITGKPLRRYVANKIKGYLGDGVSVFDGACGSGQLEEFVNPSFIYGIDVQEKAIDVFKENYKGKEESRAMSFFNFDKDIKLDCVLMNYPFSLKFKDLSEEEKENIRREFPWKKSGVVDDIFILKSLKYTKRFGFYIGFPGICYRRSEKRFREMIGNRLLELDLIENGFEDTSISVVFLVIDKDKSDVKVKKEIYDCKLEKTVQKEVCKEKEDMWIQPYKEIIKEKIDPVKLEIDARKNMVRALDRSLEFSLFVCFLDENVPPFKDFVRDLQDVLNKYKDKDLKVNL